MVRWQNLRGHLGPRTRINSVRFFRKATLSGQYTYRLPILSGNQRNAMKTTRVQPRGGEGHSSPLNTPAWRIHETEDQAGYHRVTAVAKSGTLLQMHQRAPNQRLAAKPRAMLLFTPCTAALSRPTLTTDCSLPGPRPMVFLQAQKGWGGQPSPTPGVLSLHIDEL